MNNQWCPLSRRDVYVLTVWAVQFTCNTATLDVNCDVRNTVFTFLLARPAYIMFYLAQIFREKGKWMDWEKKTFPVYTRAWVRPQRL